VAGAGRSLVQANAATASVVVRKDRAQERLGMAGETLGQSRSGAQAPLARTRQPVMVPVSMPFMVSVPTLVKRPYPNEVRSYIRRSGRRSLKPA
jgi:hypothetical protein